MGAGVVDRAQSTLQPHARRADRRLGRLQPLHRQGRGRGGKVEIGLLATTRMACPPAVMDQEDKYLKALAASKRYEIGPEGLMRFFDEAGGVTLRFSRMK